MGEVFVSPYQVISYTDVPYTEQEITPEEFEEIMKEKTGGSDDPGITYEEYTEKMGKDYADQLNIGNLRRTLFWTTPERL